MRLARRCIFAVAAALTITVPAVAAENAQTSPPAIVSIVPSQGEPGRTVTLFGSAFADGSQAMLGQTPADTRVIDDGQLQFEIPQLAPGLYAMYVRSPQGLLSRAYNFNVLAPRPVAVSLEPDQVYACTSGPGRQVTVRGRNFRPDSRIVFDGAVIRGSYESPETMTFIPPDVAGGLHQVQVKNGDETSTILGLFIEARPEISAVRQGGEYVNSYDMLIDGNNFVHGSMVVVNGTPVGSFPGEGTVVNDCTRIVYRRQPMDQAPKALSIQIVNPGGAQSQAVQVNLP